MKSVETHHFLFYLALQGNQNGFDNCGQYTSIPTCDGWAYSEDNVKRTVKAVSDFAHAIKRYGLDDVVTGFGLLNEPFRWCNQQVCN